MCFCTIGAISDVEDKDKKTALTHAKTAGHSEIIKLLQVAETTVDAEKGMFRCVFCDVNLSKEKKSKKEKVDSPSRKSNSTLSQSERPPSRESKHRRDKSDPKVDHMKDDNSKETPPSEYTHKPKSRSKSKIEIKPIITNSEELKESTLNDKDKPKEKERDRDKERDKDKEKLKSKDKPEPPSSPLLKDKDTELNQMKLQLKAMLTENQILSQQLTGIISFHFR